MRQNKRRRDIKSKLVAAICMLLVSSIMMVSTTYAWFTLSTAPEVTGINTSVGANGNLEMALLGTQASFTSPNSIVSGTSDSMDVEGKLVTEANQTWGNLVDLSDNSYGLSNIMLMPAALDFTDSNSDNVPNAGDRITDLFLAVPEYGSDGRVANLTAEGTMAAPYDSTKGFAKVADNAEANAIRYGVRGIGVSTNRSARESFYASNLSKAAAGLAAIRSMASGTLTGYAAELANIAMLYKMDGKSTFNAAEVKVVWNVLDAILGTPEIENEDGTKIPAVTGIVGTAEEALDAYSKAAFASSLNEAEYESDEDWEAAVTGADYTSWVAANEEIQEAAAAIKAVKDAAELAKNGDGTANNPALPAYSSTGTYTWAQIGGALSKLFDASAMKVCGLTLDQAMKDGKPDIGALQGAFADYNYKIVVEMNAGVFAVIADLVGEYSTMGEVTINIPSVGDTKTTITAKQTTADTSAVFVAFGATLAASPAPAGTATNPSISDVYGYVIDLAFRTNAPDSNLELQTEAAQRISGSTSIETMGGGSTVTFNSVAGFSAANMVKLMNSVKIVFFNSANNNILAVGKIDTTGLNPGANDTRVTAPIKLEGDSDVITALPTNDAMKVSVLVYLDGTTVTNKDVGIGASSMYGTLNLQFGSSANLTPMTYSEFVNANTAE